jgi:hypothetical protein
MNIGLVIFLSALDYSACSQEFEKKFYSEDDKIVDEEHSNSWTTCERKDGFANFVQTRLT